MWRLLRNLLSGMAVAAAGCDSSSSPSTSTPPVATHSVPGQATAHAMPADWADFFDQSSYDRFMKAVVEHLKQRAWTFEVRPDHILAGESMYGLMNLAQWCAQSDPSRWPALIVEHFDRIEDSKAAHDKVAMEMKDFANARERLAVRLWHPQAVPAEVADNIVQRADIEGTLSVLVLDLPETVVTVTRAQAKDWQQSDDELFAIATANLKRKSPAYVESMDAEPGLKLLLISDDSFLVSGHALCFEDHPEWIGSAGALVGFPSRDTIVAYPINDDRCIKAVAAMIRVVSMAYGRGPSSISPSLYWYRDGRFTLLPHRIGDDGGLEFHPPREFLEMLPTLRESDAG